MKSFYRRFSGHVPLLVGRLREATNRVSKEKGTARDAARAVSDAWDSVAAELQTFLARIAGSNDDGMPSGCAAVSDPSGAADSVQPVTAAASAAGTPTAGWAPLDHNHYGDHAALDSLTDPGAHPASAITNTPANGLTATTAQGAIDELANHRRRYAFFLSNGGW